jgi:osmotically-inducible protein OsmY
MTPVMIPRQNHCLATAGIVVAAAVQRLEMALHCSIRQCVRVDYREGVLVLRGQAKSYYHKQLIQEAVRGIKGVEDIENSVDVIDSDR